MEYSTRIKETNGKAIDYTFGITALFKNDMRLYTNIIPPKGKKGSLS